LTSALINRVLIVLGFAGLFISGFLSLSHLLGISLPCGPAKGCDVVATHPSAFLVGNNVQGGLPVAYVGFLGYLFLTLIAVVRSVKGIQATKPLGMVGFIGSILGAAFSGYLVYVSLNVIHATCVWCMASALVMVVTAVLYAAMLQADKPGVSKPKSDTVLAGALAVVVGLGLFGGAKYLQGQGSMMDGGVTERIVAEKIDLVPAGSHILGNPDAPVTVIEFADMLCASCQSTYPVLEELVKGSNGRVRLVFHHFPLVGVSGHEMSIPAASIAEIAAEDNKFWQFISMLYSKPTASIKSPDAILGIAASVGLNPDEIQRRLQDPEDPSIKKVTGDINLGNKIKISMTPTIFVQAKGGQPEQVLASKLEDKLNEEPYKTLILGEEVPGK
jgi:protein-disulfide isomerase